MATEPFYGKPKSLKNAISRARHIGCYLKSNNPAAVEAVPGTAFSGHESGMGSDVAGGCGAPHCIIAPVEAARPGFGGGLSL